jgi:DNA-binding GntR family transcriptional regulator
MGTTAHAIRGEPEEGKRTRVLASDVMQEVVRRIHRGEFVAGDRVREQDVADMLGVSRGPVREAFRMLEAKGVLKVEAMRGATVRRLSDRELVESVETVAVLFGLTARLAAERATPEQRGAIVARARRLETMLDPPCTAREFFVETVRIGQLVLNAAQTERLGELVIDQRMGWPNILGGVGFTTRRLRARAAAKWTRMAEAVAAGEGRTARALAEAIHHDVLAEAVKLGW